MHGRAELRLHLEILAVVHNQFDHPPHIVRAGPLARYDREQLLLLAVGRIGARQHARLLVHVARHVVQKLFHLPHGVVLVFGAVIDRPRTRHMHIRAAQLVLGHFRAQRALDQRRPAREKRAVRRHHREVPQHRARRDAARRRAGHGEDERHLLPRANVGPEHIERAGQMPVPVAFRGHIRPRPFVKDDQRNAVLARHIGEKEALEALLRGNVRRAAGNREILAAHHHLAPVYRRQPADVGQRLEINELAILVSPVARQTADFVESCPGRQSPRSARGSSACPTRAVGRPAPRPPS